jgi:hypothetical protein
MANEIDEEISTDNDDLAGCLARVERFNPSTAARESVLLPNRTDMKVMLSLAEPHGSAPIHADLVFDLEEVVAGTAQYAGTVEGDKKTLRMSTIKDRTPVFVHYYSSGGDYHEVAKVTFRNRRLAAPNPE